MDLGRQTLFLFVFSNVVLMIAAAAADTLYTSKYDNINVEEILSNPRLRNQYLNCYLGKGACITPDARFLKEKFPEALVTRCRKCTDKQKDFFDKITIWYSEHEPETWNQVVKKTIQDVQKPRH